MTKNIDAWSDSDGLIHLDRYPKLDETINAPLYTGTYICLKYKNKTLTMLDIKLFIVSLDKLYFDGEYHTYSISELDRFAHDNYTGIGTALVCCMKYLKWKGLTGYGEIYYNMCDHFLKKIPFFHKHPRDFIYLNYLKYPRSVFCINLILPVLLIPSIAMIVSCYQTHKVRNGIDIIKTDGKILAYLRFTARRMPLTEIVCTWLIEKRFRQSKEYAFEWSYSKWSNVFDRYFLNKAHPILTLIRKLDE